MYVAALSIPLARKVTWWFSHSDTDHSAIQIANLTHLVNEERMTRLYTCAVSVFGIMTAE